MSELEDMKDKSLATYNKVCVITFNTFDVNAS